MSPEPKVRPETDTREHWINACADAEKRAIRAEAALAKVRALCDEDWHRAMPGYLLVSQVRAALAAAGVHEPKPQDEPTGEQIIRAGQSIGAAIDELRVELSK